MAAMMKSLTASGLHLSLVKAMIEAKSAIVYNGI